MKRVSGEDEHPAVVGDPEVVWVIIVGVEPQLVVVVIDVEHIEVAIRVGYVKSTICATAP